MLLYYGRVSAPIFFAIRNEIIMKKTIPAIIISTMLFTGGCAFTAAPPADEPEVQEVTVNSVTDEEDPVSDVSGGDTSPEVQEPEVSEEPEEPAEPELPQTVSILGAETDIHEQSLDLALMTPDDVPAVAEAIAQMPELGWINLMNEEGVSELSVADVKTLKESNPSVNFIYDFDLFGKRVSTMDTEVTYQWVPIGNEGEEEIRNALSIFNDCQYFLLDDCGIDNEVMDGIRNDFPDTKVVWRIHVGTRSALTDDQVIRMTHGINDSMTEPLKYCHDVVYMDLGHDAGITDISFIQYMPLLECIILSDAKMTDITPLSYCHNLTWVELVYCDRLKDITPIVNLESVKYLNISYSGIRDITPIDTMNLDRFCAIAIGVSDEQLEEYKAAHPDTLAINSGNPYGYAWRYNDYGYHFFWYYARMREAFRYDQGSPGGFKLPEVWINNPPEEILAETGESSPAEET